MMVFFNFNKPDIGFCTSFEVVTQSDDEMILGMGLLMSHQISWLDEHSGETVELEWKDEVLGRCFTLTANNLEDVTPSFMRGTSKLIKVQIGSIESK
ncbi:hypothetical protein P3547_19805 [Vibrio parahaemolyticus]|nr:hypothetical protein [Vibrio parahaemolyticus]